VESYLHFIRTSLLDPQSPLVHYNQPGEKVAQSSD
jgi:hypothetical protein